MKNKITIELELDFNLYCDHTCKSKDVIIGNQIMLEKIISNIKNDITYCSKFEEIFSEVGNYQTCYNTIVKEVKHEEQ